MNSESNTITLPATPRSKLVTYCLCLLVFPLFAYLLPFLLIRVPSFERWAGTDYGPALDFGFETARQNAQVVIFGDSTSLFGINPLQMSSQLGVKVVNIPNTGGSLPVTGDMALRQYLAKNAPPKLIVFYFSPLNLNSSNKSESHILEGEEMLARHGSLADIWRFVKNHPTDSLQFPFRYFATGPKASLSALFRRDNRVADISRSMGHVNYHGFRPRLTSACKFPPVVLVPTTADYIHLLINRYSSPSTKVMTFISPFPACVNADSLAQHSFSNVPANPPAEFQARFYIDDSAYFHLGAEAVPMATENLIEAVRPQLAEILQADASDRRSLQRASSSASP